MSKSQGFYKFVLCIIEFVSCFIGISMPEGRNFIGLPELWILPCMTSQSFSAFSAYLAGWETLQMASRARRILHTQQQSSLQITVAEPSAQASQKQQLRVCTMSTCCREVLPWRYPAESWNASATLLPLCVCVVVFPCFLFHDSFSEIHPIIRGCFRKKHWCFLVISNACYIKPK